MKALVPCFSYYQGARVFCTITMHKTFTHKRALKDLSKFYSDCIGADDDHRLGLLFESDNLVTYAHKAAKELGFCCAVFTNRVVVQDGNGRQSVYTHVKKPINKTTKGLLLTHALLQHKIH